MKGKVLLLIFHIVFTVMSQAQPTIPLYEKVPNSKPVRDRERSVVTDGQERISQVSIPTLSVYLAANTGGKNPAVIICPGGGYARLAFTHEGTDVAKAFNDWGVTAFVLKYRLPDDSTMIDKSVGPLQDAQRAIQLVRENASEWNIDSARIGIMGFSAGGHLASTASTHFEKVVVSNPRNTSLRPDFSILIYPVISFSDSLAHMGSRTNLLGKDPSPSGVHHFSNETQVTNATPPAFLVHSADDKTVKVENSIRYYEALIRHKVLSEMHLYPKGGHGFGMNNKTTGDRWMERLKHWLESNDFL